jgi:vitamin B12 transporter
MSQKTCQGILTTIQLSGERQECKSRLAFIFLSLFIFSKAVTTKNFFHKMKKNLFLVAAVIFSSTLQAQDSTQQLNEVIVTANKVQQKQNETGRVLTVIGQQQLQRSYGKTLMEVLNQQVGITINGANNNLGTNQSIFMRGASAANTLILLDGMPQNDAAAINSEFDINTFNIDQIERIEILKGTQSTLYGSDAVAGVINIITKKGKGIKPQVNINATGGSFGTFRGSINLRGGVEEGADYFVGYSHVNSRGFSAAHDSTGNKNYDNDGFNQHNLQFALGFKPGKGLSGRVFGKYNINKADLDAGAFNDDADYSLENRNLNVGAMLQYKLGKTTFHLQYNNNWFDRSFTDDSLSRGGFSYFQQGQYTGKSQFTELFANIDLTKKISLVAGADYRVNASDQSYLSISAFGPFKSKPLGADSVRTKQVSVYASLLLKDFAGFYLEAGGRYNNHSIYGNNGTFSFTPSYRIGDKVKLFANVSSGYRVPSLYQLYSEYGNTALLPETSLGFEGGVSFNQGNTNARLVGFKRQVKDVFIFYYDASTFRSFYKNEDEQNDFGIEAEASTRLMDKLTLSANYTYIDGEITSRLATGKDTSFFNLYRRPAHTINFTAGYQLCKKAFVSAHVRSVGKFFEPRFASAPIEMKGYYTLDLYGEYKPSDKVRLFADIQNITDQRYFDLRGFNSRRFNWSAGITLNL